jgi:Zn-dependent M28 family amino/carboxypeptidase
MQLLSIIKSLEGLSNNERFLTITQMLSEWEMPYSVQEYATGKNIIVNGASGKKFIGISSHFDVVPGSSGANDNGSAVAVCLHILQKCKTHVFKHFGVDVFTFDEEENHLRGSRAYVAEKGIGNMLGLINLEMVGMGDRFALWPLNVASSGPILETLEAVAAGRNILTGRFDNIVTNYADHGSFLEAGLTSSFSVTGISTGDLTVAGEYYAALAAGEPFAKLAAIMEKAPLFKHYHKPTDLSVHLSETSLQTAAHIIWQTLLKLDEIGIKG